MPTDSSTFVYGPLTESDGIRLLNLHPATSRNAPLCCSLIHTTLWDCTYDFVNTYTALSYVWGDATKVESILLNGLSVNITVNLYSALRDIRDSTRDLRVWADALCINQRDDEEKGKQVGMMGEIYSTANHTVIYIGVDDREHEDPDGSLDPAFEREDLQAVLKSTWLRRVWVFQELLLSKDPWVQHGRRRWPWSQMRHAENTLQTQNQVDRLTHDYNDGLSGLRENSFLSLSLRGMANLTISPVQQKLLENGTTSDASISGSVNTDRTEMEFWRDINQGRELLAAMCKSRERHQQGNRLSMLENLITRRALGATDSRDLIWAHLGISSDGHKEVLKADYVRKSTTSLMNDFACYQILKDQSLALLSHVSKASHPGVLEELASWAPDWRLPKVESPCAFVSDATQKQRPRTRWDTKPKDRGETSPYTTISSLHALIYIGAKNNQVVKCSCILSSDRIPASKVESFRQRFSTYVSHLVILSVTSKSSKQQLDSNVSKSDLESPGSPRENLNDIDAYPMPEGFYELCKEIFDAWRDVVQDDDILGLKARPSPYMVWNRLMIVYGVFSENVDRHNLTQVYGWSVDDVDLVELWLVVFFAPGFASLFIEGKTLARLNDNRLIIAPSDAQVGDILSLGALLKEDGFVRFDELLLLREAPESSRKPFNEKIRQTILDAVDPGMMHFVDSDSMDNKTIVECRLVGCVPQSAISHHRYRYSGNDQTEKDFSRQDEPQTSIIAIF